MSFPNPKKHKKSHLENFPSEISAVGKGVKVTRCVETCEGRTRQANTPSIMQRFGDAPISKYASVKVIKNTNRLNGRKPTSIGSALGMKDTMLSYLKTQYSYERRLGNPLPGNHGTVFEVDQRHLFRSGVSQMAEPFVLLLSGSSLVVVSLFQSHLARARSPQSASAPALSLESLVLGSCRSFPGLQ